MSQETSGINKEAVEPGFSLKEPQLMAQRVGVLIAERVINHFDLLVQKLDEEQRIMDIKNLPSIKPMLQMTASEDRNCAIFRVELPTQIVAALGARGFVAEIVDHPNPHHALVPEDAVGSQTQILIRTLWIHDKDSAFLPTEYGDHNYTRSILQVYMCFLSEEVEDESN